MANQLSWAHNAFFYHIYPLGCCGAPQVNDFVSTPVNRLEQLTGWIPHMKDLGCNALYLGPVFESDFHGYDTADYFLVDRRLGINQTLKDFSKALCEQDIKLVPDAVFNHVGRHFAPFLDLKANREDSVYKDWFCGVDFSSDNAYGDGFTYEGWYNAYNLVRLNLENPGVKQYLLDVVAYWMDEFNIEGLRLDVAEIMDKQFLSDLAAFCHQRNPEFWLMGEVIQGDYNQWANADRLDSTTNYEAYKGLYSSHNEQNYFEIAYTLNRQSGADGVYKDLLLYNFADNHDMTRAASILNNKAHLFSLYAILFTMPGIPSVYYGSEWGIEGVKGAHDDFALRPQIKEIPDLALYPIYDFIKRLAGIRHKYTALRYGNYRELYVTELQLIYERETMTELVIVAVNIAQEPMSLVVKIHHIDQLEFFDALDPAYQTAGIQGELLIKDIPANGIRILIGNVHY